MKTGIPYGNEGWNFLIGCPGGGSKGCLNCWARELHQMRHAAYQAGKKMPAQYEMPFCEIQVMADRIEEPYHWKRPRVVPVCFQSDLFHGRVPSRVQYLAMEVMAECPDHTFLLLTKNAINMRKRLMDFFGGTVPGNIYPGISVCDRADSRKIEVLKEVPSDNRWVSFEPLLEDVLIDPVFHLGIGELSWVVIGCESGTNRRPCSNIWIEDMMVVFELLEIKVYVKQVVENGKVNKNPGWTRDVPYEW